MYNKNLLDLLEEYYTLSVDDNGWVVRNLLGNQLTQSNMDEIIVGNPLNQESLKVDVNTFNQWLESKRKIHLKPVLDLLEDYTIVRYNNKWVPICKITGSELNLKEKLGENKYQYSDPILKQTILLWISEKLKEM